MLAVLPFCSKDAKAALNLLHWMAELGPMKNHSALLVADAGLSYSVVSDIHRVAAQLFSRADVTQLETRDLRGHPRAANGMFRHTMKVVAEKFKCPFWWNEPDCIPLCPQWLDMLENEYDEAGLPFMGAVVHTPLHHLTGCAIYPATPAQYNPSLATDTAYAWDAVRADKTLRHTHHTKLFFHLWTERGGALPTFPNAASLKRIPASAVVLHRNKNHDLIERLREQRR